MSVRIVFVVFFYYLQYYLQKYTIHVCFSPAGRSLLGKTMPKVIVFPNTDRPRPVNNNLNSIFRR